MSDNLYMDKLIQYLKTLALGCVLKNEDLADKNETLASLKLSDTYISCIDNTADFQMFDYNREVLENSMVPYNIIQQCIMNKNDIPEAHRSLVLENQKAYFIKNYEELNNYYRMLSGTPPCADTDYIYVTEGGVPSDIPIHKLDNTDIENLKIKGILDSIIEKYPNKRYLNFLGTNKIDIYKARKARNFSLLYLPEIESELISNRFKELLEKNMVYTMKSIYSEAFKYNSDYYDNFIEIFIIVQAISDMIIEIPENVIRKEFFDEMSIRDMFLSHGIDYFPEIPLRYQLKMIRNLNELLKFKSTTKNLVDICSIFGFENVSIFKYYLLRDRKIDKNGNFVEPVYYQQADNSLVEIPSSVYELKFVKVPINGDPDDYIRNSVNHLNYDDITYGDKFWDAEPDESFLDNIDKDLYSDIANIPEYWNNMDDHDKIKNAIILNNFNYEYSKYLSIDTIYDMSSLSFELTYLFNMIFDNIELEELLVMPIKNISFDRRFKLTDIICLLYGLMYARLNVEDTILDSTSKILHVTAFNFKADLAELSTYVQEQGFTMEELGVSDFTIPKNDFLTYNQMINIYIKNKKVYNHIVQQLYYANDYRIYKIYKKIYDALMVSELNTQIFKKNDGEFAGSYSAYLKDRDYFLYNFLENIKLLDDSEKEEKIISTIDSIVLSLEEYLKTDKFNFSFTKMTNISSELVKQYVFKVINFFKSYTVDMLSMNTIYHINDRYSNKVNILDNITIQSNYIPSDPSYNNDKKADFLNIQTKSIIMNDKVNVEEVIFITQTYN